MDRTRWIIFAAVCLALLGFLVFSNDSTKATFEGDPAKVVAGDNVYGNRDAKVVLIEYGDFQCPGCRAFYPVLKEVKEDYKEQTAFVFRHMPISTIHPHAEKAARSAQAAGNQGKFWEMHDKIYENQESWKDAQGGEVSRTFTGYAREIGLDINQWEDDVESEETERRVKRDLAAAQKAGYQLSTPTIVLNGKKINAEEIQVEGQFSAAKLRQLLNEALRAAGEQPPKAAASTE